MKLNYSLFLWCFVVVALIVTHFVDTSAASNSCFGIDSTSATACSSRGFCIANNTCTCFPGWAGSNCELQNVGFSYSSGLNNYGQIGDGFTSTKYSLFRVASWFGLLRVNSISAGSRYSLALTDSGTVYAWGYNGYGQLGTGDTANQYLPVQIGGALAGKKIVSIAACMYHSIALDSNGVVYTWGVNSIDANNWGWLGYGVGDKSNSYLPKAVAAGTVPANAVGVYCGKLHSLALTATGAVYAWGSNQGGQIGDSTTINRETPRRVTLNILYTTIVSIACGQLHTVALANDGYVYAWGSSTVGQLGDANSDSHLVTAPMIVEGLLSGKYVVGIAANNLASYALASDGILYSWGYNNYGQLGDGTGVMKSTPIKVKYPAAVQSITTIFSGCMSNSIFMITNTSSVYALGENAYGMFGTGSAATSNVALVKTSTPFPSSSFTSISAGESHALFMVNGTTCYSVFAEDANACTSHGVCVATDTCVCNSGFTEYDCSIPICYGLNASDPLVCSGHGQCMTNETCICYDGYNGDQCENSFEGYLYAGGDDTYGQLGDGNSATSLAQFVPVVSRTLKGVPVARISAGVSFSLVNLPNGTLYSFGYNSRGNLGDGTTANRVEPYSVFPGKNIVGSCAGYIHSLALDNNGTVYAFGDNQYGQLGQGSTTPVYSAAPVKVGGVLADQFVVAVSCGIYHSAVLTSNGTVFTWGYNAQGQLGDGTTTNRATPTQVYIAGVLYKKRVAAVSAGGYHTLALVADGTVYSWGYNNYNQIGDKTATNAVLPYQVGDLLSGKKVISLSAAPLSSYAATSEGSLYSWGYNGNGQLGDATTTQRSSPVKIGGVLANERTIGISSGIAHPSTVLSHVMILTANATVFVSGDNRYGQLGDGTINQANSPKAYSLYYPNRKVLAVSAGYGHSLIIYNLTNSCFGVLSDDPSVCSYHGNCSSFNTCSCQDGYSGPDCSIFSCFNTSSTSPSVCSSHGTCVALDTCVCSKGFSGDNCDLKVFGLAYALGQNNVFQLADDDMVNTYSPVMMGGQLTRRFVSGIQAGGDFSVVQTSDGAVMTNGRNYAATIGDGTQTDRQKPFRISVLSPPSNKVVDICAGSYHAFAVAADGKIMGWGNAFFGDMTSSCPYIYGCNYGTIGPLSGSTTRYSAVPVTVSGINTAQLPINVACGRGHTTVLTANGTVWSFGYNVDGEVGIGSSGTYSYITNPGPVLGILNGVNVIKISAGNYHTLALGSNGEVYAWGRNNYGQIGDSTTTEKRTPMLVLGDLAGKVVVDVAAGVFSSHAVTSDGHVYSWGYNSNGQLGDGTTTNRYVPTLVRDLVGVPIISISTSKENAFTLALSADGTAYSWGVNANGQLGDTSTTQRTSPVLVVNNYPSRKIVAVSGGSTHSMFIYNGTFCFGVLSDDPTVCFSRGSCISTDTCECLPGYYGPECEISTCFGYNSTDVEVCSSRGTCTGLDSCSCNSGYTGPNCELLLFGYTFTLGDNSYGQLGDDYYDAQKLPVQTAYPLTFMKYSKLISSGIDASFAITTDNELYSWGKNSYGLLGDGTTSNRNRPARVLPDNTFVSVASSTAHTLAADVSGRVWAWGVNTLSQQLYCTYYGSTYYCSETACTCSSNVPTKSGQLGLGSSYYYSYTPRVVVGIPANTPVIQVACGSYHSLALTANGTVYSWGYGPYGQLGDGTASAYQHTAVLVGSDPSIGGMIGDIRIIAIAAGDSHSLALTDHGEVYSWGYNNVGQLGDSTTTNKRNPRKVTGALFGEMVVKIAAGRLSSYALTAEGRVFAWGDNSKGQLGIGSTTQQRSPVLVSSLNNITSLSAGTWSDYVLVTSSNGTTYGWGENANGQIGDNTVVLKNRPTPVYKAFSKRVAVAVSAAATHSMFIYNTTYCFSIPDDDPSVCSYRGSCTGTDTCVCQSGYTGANCSIAICYNITGDDPSVCSGNGRCLYEDTCICQPGYSGLQCESADQRFLFASGDDTYSQLGDGFFTTQNYPRQSSVFSRKLFHYTAAGDGFSFAVNFDSGIYALGNNAQGQLGDGTTVNRYYPAKILDGKSIVRLVACNTHSLALDISGEVFTWGLNDNGQLGTGDRLSYYSPTPIKGMVNQTVVSIACGTAHSMALTSEGYVYTWGLNSDGQLGDGSSTGYRAVPYRVQGLLNIKRIVDIAAGNIHSLALSEDGSVYSWGDNSAGQLGDGKVRDRVVPYPVLGTIIGKAVRSISAGASTSYAMLVDGTIYSWGANTKGQIGDNTIVNKPLPTLNPISNMTNLAASTSGNFAVAFNMNGTAFAWGENSKGQLGDGTFIDPRKSPVAVTNTKPQRYITSVSPGKTHSLYLYAGTACFGILYDDPTVCSWHGNCTEADTCVCEPNYTGPDCSVSVCFEKNGTDPNVCSGHGRCISLDTCVCRQGYSGKNCEIVNYGFLFASGDDSDSQLGDRNIGIQPTVIQARLFMGIPMHLIVGAYKYTLLRAVDGTVYGLGNNQYGQLGDGTNQNRSLPVQIPLKDKNIVGLCGGFSHAMALDISGKVYSWGSNNYGQLGINSTTNSWTPVRVSALDGINIVSIACGYYHSLALSDTGVVYSWGYNVDGELGDNSQINKNVPVTVGGLLSDKKIVAIASGAYHSIALGSDGTVYNWGMNNRGQLGDTTTTMKILPVQVAGLLFGRTVKSVTAGMYFSSCLTSDGAVFSWGANNNGQLGDGTTVDKLAPVAALGLPANNRINTLSAGGNFVLALSDNTTTYSWGDNFYGELGDGKYNITVVTKPVRVVNPYALTYAVNVAAGNTFSLFLLNGTTCFGKFVEDPSVCSSKGQCIAQDVCQCFPFYNAEDCSSYNCFGLNGTDPNVCSGRGSCIAADACICRPGYRGDQCEQIVSGYVYALGDDSKSQLGDGYTFTQTLPTVVGGLISGKPMSAIASGIDFTIAASINGQVYGWGVNDQSQLGDNSTIDRPMPVMTVGIKTKVVALCAGNSHGVAVDEFGHVYAWGSNYYGQIGNGDYSFRNVPVPTRVQGLITNETIITVACGAFHTLALSDQGRIYGWGNNVDGQLGDGTNMIQVLPVRVGDGLIDNILIATISAGYRHSLAIGPFGVLYAWGSNSYGQLGDGSTFNKYSPTEVSPPEIRGKIAIASVGSSDNSYLVSLDGGVFSWGGAFFGQLGDNSTLVQYKPTPQRVNTNITNPRTVYGGRDSAFVLSREGASHSWGSNTYGQLGDNSLNNQRNNPVQVLNTYRDRYIISIAPGRTHTAFLYNATSCFGFLSDDENVCSSRGICIANDVCQCAPSFQYHDCSVVACNGRNSTDPMVCSGHGQCLPNNTCVCYPLWRGIDCESQAFGYMYGTGQDQVSQLGDGGVEDSHVLIKGRSPTIDRKPMRYLASGLSFSFAISTNDEVYSFGINDQGQLGDGTTNNARIPVLNKLSGNISSISAGYSFAVAIGGNNSAYSWGSNVYGQLGLGTAGGQRTTPTLIQGLENLQVAHVSCGLGHCLAVTFSGEIYAWGANDHAQLGDGTTSTTKSKYQPIRVMSIFSIKKAAYTFAGAYHSIAISIDGILYSWGDNSRGELGDGTTSTSFRLVPQKVLGLEDHIIVDVSGGEFFSCALTKYGKIYCWGANEMGQLGDGTYNDRHVPTKVTGAVASHKIVKINGGSSGFMLALSDDGLLFGWGYNSNGQLGDNSTYPRSVPIQIGNYTLRSSQFVTAGRFHSLTLFNGTTCFNVLQDDSDVCSGNGTCVDWDTCVCRNGFSGVNCEFTSCNGVNATDPNVCSGHGECKYLDTCICTGGQYLGDVCQYDACFNVASVDPKVCSGHGRCVAPGNCTCDPGYVGSNCEHTVCYGRNTSDPLICSGKGFCFTPDNCLCFNTPQPGYTGGNCSAPVCYSRFVDRVTGIETILQLPQATNNLTVDTSLVCSGHGTCNTPNKCTCKTGFTDQYCSTPICFNKTATDPAVCNYGRNGTCVDYNNCTCLTYFENGECVPLVCFGKNSTTIPPACNADRGRGNCLNIDLCACQKGYGGLECEQNICNGVLEYNYTKVCHGRGRCDLPDECTCLPGYNGTDCQYSNCYGKLDNNPDVCSGHGTCSGPNSCTCHPGYAGAQCQLPICYGKISNDSANVCSGHGTCQSPDNCECKYGYSGLECLFPSCFELNSTEPDACSGNGLCYEPNKCNCTTKYEGMDCSIPTCFGVRATKRNVCSSNGFCVLPDTCDCFVGRTGINCEENVCFGLNQTDSNVCSGHGTCYGPNRCNCTQGYTGFDCAIPICYSTPAIYAHVCSGEGVCTAPDVCNCTSGRSGENCDLNICFDIEETNNTVCSEHGTCAGPDKCECSQGYTGDKCQYPTCNDISAADPNVCNRRGECSEPDSCVDCSPGWSGSDCEIPTCFSVPASNITVCSGKGACVHPDTCVCESGFTGADCEAVDDICAETYIMVTTVDENGDQVVALADVSCGIVAASFIIPAASKVVYNQYSNVFMLFMNGGIYKLESTGSVSRNAREFMIPQFIQSFEIEDAESTVVYVNSATELTIVTLVDQIKVHHLDLLYRNETLFSTVEFQAIPGANDTRYVTRDENNNIYVLAKNENKQTGIVEISPDGTFSSVTVFVQFPRITDLQGLMYANGHLFVNTRSMLYRVRSSGALVSSVEIFGGFFATAKVETDTLIYLNDPNMQHLMKLVRTDEVLVPVYIPYPRDLKGKPITLLGPWIPVVNTVTPSYLSINKQGNVIGFSGQYLMFNGLSTVVLHNRQYDITAQQNLLNCLGLERLEDVCFAPYITLPDGVGHLDFEIKINVAGGQTSTEFGMLPGVSISIYRTVVNRIHPTTAYQGDTVKIMAPYFNPTSNVVCVFKQMNATGEQQEIQTVSTFIGSSHIDCPVPKFDSINQDTVVVVTAIMEGETFTAQQADVATFVYYVDIRAQSFYETFDDSGSILQSVNQSSFALPQHIEWIQYDERTGRSLVNLTSVLPENNLIRSAVLVDEAMYIGNDKQVNVEFILGTGVGNLMEVWLSNFGAQAHIYGSITNSGNNKQSVGLVYKLGEGQSEGSVQSDCSFASGEAYNMILKLVRPEMESLHNGSGSYNQLANSQTGEFLTPWRIDVQLKSQASILCQVSFTPDVPVKNMSSLMLGSSVLLGQSLVDSNPNQQQQELQVFVDRVWIGCQYSSCNETNFIPGDGNNIIRNNDRYKAAMIGLSSALGALVFWILIVIIIILLVILARMFRKRQQEKKKASTNMKDMFDKAITDVELRDQMAI